MGTSTTATAKPWLELPTRRISPLRTYQTVPLTSRIVVIRRPTASTVPDASPTSTTSPTPYWSSSIMNTPERKSFTTFWAPNPMATPRMPAEASTGARFTPSSARIIMNAVPYTTTDVIDLNTEPIVLARWARRSDSSDPSACGARSRSGRRSAGTLRPPLVRVIRSISLRASDLMMTAMTRMSRIVSGLATSQLAELASQSTLVILPTTLHQPSLSAHWGSIISGSRSVTGPDHNCVHHVPVARPV